MNLRKKRDPVAVAANEMAQAEAALDKALQEQEEAREQTSWRKRLQEGWDRVHERNNLSELFLDEYRRAR